MSVEVLTIQSRTSGRKSHSHWSCNGGSNLPVEIAVSRPYNYLFSRSHAVLTPTRILARDAAADAVTLDERGRRGLRS